jgi:hypothetical protein
MCKEMRHNKENGEKNDEEACAEKEVIQGGNAPSRFENSTTESAGFFSLTLKRLFVICFSCIIGGGSPV